MLDGVYFFVQNQKMKHRLRTCQFVHMMFNDKFCTPFVDFLNRNFNPDEHLVICKRWFKEHPFPHGSNVIEVKNLKHVDFSHKNIKKVICHSLFDGELVQYLYDHPDILKKKAYWVMWGGDLYEAPRDKVNDFVRKNFSGYCGEMDKEYALRKYEMNASFYNVHYPFSTTVFDSDDFVEKQPNKNIKVQINNSCDYSTIEMLDILYKFQPYGIKVRTVLSYGDLEYKNKVICKGIKLFGNNFEYLNDFIPPKDYGVFARDNDILILNQKRQQGVGNIVLNVQCGNKVFIRNDVSVYNYLNNVENVKIFDTNSIHSMNYDDFIKNDYVSQNRRNMRNFTSKKRLFELWKGFFYE